MEKKITVGRVLISPLDVILDRDLDLGVQPDLMLISQADPGILRHRVWELPTSLAKWYHRAVNCATEP